MSLTTEQITQIAVQAALAAVAAAQSGGDVPPAEVGLAAKIDAADENEDREIAETFAAHDRELEQIAEATDKLLPLIMQARHLVVFSWLAKERGVSDAELLRQIVRAEMAGQLPAWREANGKGGSSTKSAETMARLKGE